MVHDRRNRLTLALLAGLLSLAAGCAQPASDPAPTVDSPDLPAATAAPAEEETTAPEPLGRWSATCTDVAADAGALRQDLQKIPDSAAPQDREQHAAEATTPVAQCDALYLMGLAHDLSEPGGDPDLDAAALAVMTHATGGASLPGTTEIIDFTPFDDEGRVAHPDERIEEYQPFIHEYCLDTPVSTGDDVYQCGSIAHYLPACWRADDYGLGMPTFACMHLPGDDRVIFVVSEDPDVDPAPAASNPSPWQAELADGSTCRVRLGGAWPQPPEGFIWSHSCDGGPTQALLMPDDRSPVLNSIGGQEFVLGAANVDETALVEVLPVVEAIFAGQRPTPPALATGSDCPAPAELEPVLREHYEGEGVGILTEFPLECTKDWVFGVVGDEWFASSFALGREGDSWHMPPHEEVCTHPSPLPPSLFGPHCLIG